MAFDEQRLKYLLRLCANDNATKEEVKEMVALLREHDEGELEFVDWERIWDKVHETTVGNARVRRMKWMRVAAAAVIVVIGTGAYFFNQPEKQQPNQKIAATEARNVQQDVLPGGNKAILTLANGEEIILDSAANGVLAQQGNANVVKLANGQLAYKGTGAKADEIVYNTLGTPRGGQYRLVLPDGSKVWLNAISSIRYPTAFTGKERIVEITGEAYFEVVKDISKPFKVLINRGGFINRETDLVNRETDINREPKFPSLREGPGVGSNDLEITVLGTHFNVNAYSDEPTIKTTLVEGSVKVTRKEQSVTIKPGEQTLLNNSGTLKVIHDANVDEAVAWRNGLFEFQDTDLQSILRQVMRWYDVDVDYQGNIPERYFTAIISRDKTLTGVLEILKLSDIDYKLEGKKLVITQ
jgi:ferric-dicitrate binding protein FerR (iron transport regulator)